jgi:FkbM family methyltransferase
MTASTSTPQDWRLATASGSVLLVPPTTGSLTTWVLLEQEGWFEPEMAWLPRWLQPGMQVLDIGANHGVYTVEIARAIGDSGHVYAFEPTRVPRGRLLDSVAANGLQQRVTVVPAGLADANGTARFLVQHNSELNARDANMAVGGAEQQHEEVQLLALDPFLAAAAPGTTFDFVKLDAEGDELRVIAGAERFFAEQSPVVMFEFMHGASHNPALAAKFRELGFGIFKLAAEIGVLMPFDEYGANTGFALNLFAVREPQQRRMADAGLLLLPGALETEGAVRRDPAVLADWCGRPGLRGTLGDAAAAPDTGQPLSPYDDALWAVAAAHRQAGLSPAQRVALLIDARERMFAALDRGDESGPEAWLLLVHTFWALGEPGAALQLGSQLLAQWSPEAAAAIPIVRAAVPPQRADLERRRSTPLAAWLRQCLAEWLALRSAWSAYFQQPAPQRWADLLRHPDHGDEIERRYLLAQASTGGVADLRLVTNLAEPGSSANPALWSQVMAAIGVGAPAPKPAAGAAESIPAAVPALEPADVLEALPREPIDVVDVGASSHGPGTAPYSALLNRGHARITAFEPDAAACAVLVEESRRWTGEGHRILAQFVGDGALAEFHATNWHMTGSLLPANTELLSHFHLLAESTRLHNRQPVPTVRLDDVLPPGGLDLLKIDVQGAELAVFDGAARLLDECLAVWTEVAFSQVYKGQPLFGDIAARLARHGLMFHSFDDASANVRTEWAVPGTPMPPRPQVLWSDAIFVPTPERLARLSASGAARLALIAHHTVGAWDLCHAALRRHDALKGGELAAAYRQAWIRRAAKR